MNWNRKLLIYQRHSTRPVPVGNPDQGGIIIGGDHPIIKQSMLTTNTLDTEACVQQTLRLVEAGAELVRLTAQTVRHAANLKNIGARLRSLGCQVPLVADIHFKPQAALEATRWVEKIRINPGNYADRKKFQVREYTEEQYAAELQRVEEAFTPLVLACKERGRALRIGTNHGSLSDRITNRYGDTPEGMVESALEFARICRKHDFHHIVFSMKASNPKITIQAYRLLVHRLAELGPDWNYPIHLGVTEAGEGEDGRLKSAIGIGPLLCDGIGDTIRVSLTEPPENELPVCEDLIRLIPILANHKEVPILPLPFEPFCYRRLPTRELSFGRIRMGDRQPVRVLVTRTQKEKLDRIGWSHPDVVPEGVVEDWRPLELNPLQPLPPLPPDRLVTVADSVDLPPLTAFRLLAARLHEIHADNPILLKDQLQPLPPDLTHQQRRLHAAVVLGGLLIDGIGDAILVRNVSDAQEALNLGYEILQAAGVRSFRTEYIACPGCGRTLFNLQEVLARIKARTSHLKGIKIAVMGCVVNGPGEMADADFGYVGGAPGKVNLYVGKTPVKFNVPEDQAVDALIELIKEHGKWQEPAEEENP